MFGVRFRPADATRFGVAGRAWRERSAPISCGQRLAGWWGYGSWPYVHSILNWWFPFEREPERRALPRRRRRRGRLFLSGVGAGVLKIERNLPPAFMARHEVLNASHKACSGLAPVIDRWPYSANLPRSPQLPNLVGSEGAAPCSDRAGLLL